MEGKKQEIMFIMLFYVIILLITLVGVVLFDVVLLQLYLLNWAENQMLNCFCHKIAFWFWVRRFWEYQEKEWHMIN